MRALKVALCVMLDAILSADAKKSKSCPGTGRRGGETRILLAAGTNVAVDR